MDRGGACRACIPCQQAVGCLHGNYREFNHLIREEKIKGGGKDYVLRLLYTLCDHIGFSRLLELQVWRLCYEKELHLSKSNIQKTMAKRVKASDCKCVKCGKQAVAFWPVFDPDIPAYPYCRECLNRAQAELMMELEEIDKKYKNNERKTRSSRKGTVQRGC